MYDGLFISYLRILVAERGVQKLLYYLYLKKLLDYISYRTIAGASQSLSMVGGHGNINDYSCDLYLHLFIYLFFLFRDSVEETGL